MNGTVYVRRAASGDVPGINAAVQALLNELPSMGQLGPESRVLIKPNLLSRNNPVKAVTTHPDVLRAVILALQARGVQNITVADSPGGPYSPAVMRTVYDGCGLTAVCEETNVSLYTDCKWRHVETKGALVPGFDILEPVLDADFIINLPKFKTHVLMGMSGAVKNLFGCIPGLAKAELHMRFPERAHFGRMLVDLCETVKPTLTLVDGLTGMEGDGPSGGTARQLDLLLASEDPHSLDLCLCRYMGLGAERVPTMADAIERGLSAGSFDEALLLGDEGAKSPISNFVPPRSYEGRVDFLQRLPKALRWMLPAISAVAAPRPIIRKAKCIVCGKCAEICPERVITIADGKASIAPKNCIRCFCCHEMCPVQAIGVRRFALFKL